MTRSRPALLTLAALALAGACSREAPGGPPPRPTAVVPPIGYAVSDLHVVIRGDGFNLRAYQDLGSPRLDAGFRAWIGGVALGGVAWAAEGELRALVPAGLAPGVHDVVVEDPWGRRGTLAGGFRVLAGTPPVVTATASVAPLVVLQGQPLEVEVVVRNDGDSPALSVVPEFAVTGGGVVTPSPAPAPRDLAARTSTTFSVPFTATAAGTARLEVAVAGFDPTLGASLRTDPELAGTVTVVSAGTGAATITARAPTAVVATQGDIVTLDVVYVNTAGEDVATLTPAATTNSATASLSLVELPPPCAVRAGATCTASFRLAAGAPGDATLVVDAAGVTAGGAPVAAPEVVVSFHVVAPARLAGEILASPSVVAVGQPVAVTLVVRNTGGLPVLGVRGQILAAPIAADPGVDPPPQDIAPGATVSFVWAVVPHRTGTGAFVAAASGQDPRGVAVELAPLASAPVSIQ